MSKPKKLLSDLLRGIECLDPVPNFELENMSIDSRSVQAGDVFVALPGKLSHGLVHAELAVANGAEWILLEVEAEQVLPIPNSIRDRVLRLPKLRQHLGLIAARLSDNAQTKLRIVGVTGTNGKTSTVQLIAQSLDILGCRPATIGTLGVGLFGDIKPGARTTPDVLSLHREIQNLVEFGASDLAIEVSSHALDQGRVDGLHFDLAIFTNLTRDHLDYHLDMDSYAAAKAKLFAWPALGIAVINIDDEFGRTLANKLRAQNAMQVITTGVISDDADIRAKNIVADAEGLAFDLISPKGWGRANSVLLGHFNVANLLGVVATLMAFSYDFDDILALLKKLTSVRGRMNRLGGTAQQPLVVIDYAHSPDALEKTLATVRTHTHGELICVFGCGGDRDSGKRAQMGAIAERLADCIFITDDNPRNESGDVIVEQICTGLNQPERANVIRDRGLAIRAAIRRARRNDTVVVAGKGHETYQEINGVLHHFDDLEVAQAVLMEAA